MNRAELRDEVYDRIGSDSNDAAYPTSTIDRQINSAIHFIEAEHDCPWLGATTTFPTVAGQAAYPVPTDWGKTFSLRVDRFEPFARYDIDDLDERWTSATSTGQPVEWAVWAEQIELRPIPDSVYTVIHRYYKVEPDLMSDTDTPLMPARFHTVVAEVATWLALRRDREDPRAVGAFNAYEQWRKRLADHENRFAGPMKVKVKDWRRG